MSRRKVIALLMGSPGLRTGDYQGLLRTGVEQRCMDQNVDLWVYAGRNNWDIHGTEGLVYDFMPPDRVEGIILASAVISCFCDARKLLAKLRQRYHVPICSMALLIDGAPSVLIDNRFGVAVRAALETPVPALSFCSST